MSCSRCKSVEHDLHQCKAPIIGLGVTVMAPLPDPPAVIARGKRPNLTLPHAVYAQLTELAGFGSRAKLVAKLIAEEHFRREFRDAMGGGAKP